MRAALAAAGLQPGDLGYVNLHGTATPANDVAEGLAVARVFGAAVPCSSTKGATGHTLGAAGALEAVVCALASLVGYQVFDTASPESIAFVEAFAGGAILTMLADTMMPEAFEHGGKAVGLLTTLGFGLAFLLSTLA